ncbi:MAG: succinate dehydrogenase [Candidatus Kariarchaeaceae archaeon]
MTDTVPLTTVEEKSYWRNRKDLWWGKPALQAFTLGGFIIYAFIVIMFDFKGDHYKVEGTHYVSPFFSPEIEIEGWPNWLSPALVLIWAPIGFRATCYYARKVYFRAFLADPPGCAIGEFRKMDGKYKGESSWPFILNNLHRYFFYAAFVLAIIHWYEFFLTWKFGSDLGFGFGTLLFGLDALFLSLYVISCHSFKHLIGGGVDCDTCKGLNKTKYKGWKMVKKLNENHHTYFWISLFMILIVDVYVRMLSRGTIDDVWRWIF